MSMLWKPTQSEAAPAGSTVEPIRPVPPAPILESAVRLLPVQPLSDQASIGKGLTFKGVINGSGSLYVDGEVIGNINLPQSRVTVGPNGEVSDGLSVCINAREIVIFGKVRGNISALDSVEIRAEGTVIGDVSSARISIADGAFFKGDINLSENRSKPVSSVLPEMPKRAYA